MTSIIDPGDVDTMPGWEWYREQRDELADERVDRGERRRRHTMADDLAGLRQLAAQAGLPEVLREIDAELAAIGEWRCPACGGPRTVADLSDTLRYPACGYGLTGTGQWGHA
jgi:hypothetical protein